MDKKELLSLANKGPVKIGDITAEIVVRPSALDGTPWLEIEVEQFTPFAAPLHLGDQWVEYITDEACDEIPRSLNRYKEAALAFEARAKARTVRLKPFTSDCEILIDADDNSKKPKLYRIKNFKDHFEIPGLECMIELNGITYAPVWSYWLDRACYRYPEQRREA
jgi:hypothetical protein